MNDLVARSLMVGGGSPPELQIVQQRVIETLKGICLAPGFLNDHYDEFAWIPFNCSEKVN